MPTLSSNPARCFQFLTKISLSPNAASSLLNKQTLMTISPASALHFSAQLHFRRCQINYMNAHLYFINSDGSMFFEYNILSFSFHKDAYLPYSSLSASIVPSNSDFSSVCEIKLFIGAFLVHHGLVDTLDFSRSGGSAKCSLSSKGFTSLLCSNQLQPGLKSSVSLNSLMDSFYSLPYVTHEDNSDSSNYIYVKNGSAMWDGVANLSFKLYGSYPFIRGTNCVRITPPASPSSFSFSDSQLLKSGSSLDFRHLISNFHMADINGNYGQYDLQDDSVVNRKIVRHLCFDLDKQFLSDPPSALTFRDKFSSRASRSLFCTRTDFGGEDLFDHFSFGSHSNLPIHSISAFGSSNGIFTTLSSFSDGFNPS